MQWVIYSENRQQWEDIWWQDKKILCPWYKWKKTISNSYAFVLGSSDENPKESLKERIEEFEYFRDDFGKSQFICKETKGGILMWKLLYTD